MSDQAGAGRQPQQAPPKRRGTPITVWVVGAILVAALAYTTSQMIAAKSALLNVGDRIGQAMDDKEAAEKKLAAAKGELASVATIREKAKADVQDALAGRAAAEAQVTELSQALDTANAALAKAKEDAGKSRSAANKLKSDLAKARAQLNETIAKMAETQAEADQLRSRLSQQ